MSNKAAWIQNTLTELLTSPHISIRNPGHVGIHMGPGPVDLFTTRFNNVIAPDIKAIVAGQSVDRDGLKKKLLALQKYFDPNTAQFQSQNPGDQGTTTQGAVHVLLTGTSKLVGNYEISVAADVAETDGRKRLYSLKLDGNPELFAETTA